MFQTGASRSIPRWDSCAVGPARPVLSRTGPCCENVIMRTNSDSSTAGSAGSLLSIGSSGSILSIGSSGSILSIGSAGSILSIGSAGSVASVFSVGSAASAGSILSGCSYLSLLAWRSRRAIGPAGRRAKGA
jgi:hypothetical protein